MRATSPAHRSSVLRQEGVFGFRSDPDRGKWQVVQTYKLVESTSHAHGGLRAVKYI